VCDAVKELAEKTQQEFDAPRCYLDADEACRASEAEAVLLSVPHYLHAPLSLAALRSGKHVFVEKPLALTAGDADEMIAEAERRGLALMSGQSLRFVPEYRHVRDIIQGGRLGRVLHVVHRRMGYCVRRPNAWWNEQAHSAGVLGHRGSHSIDAILWWLDDQPKRVFAQAHSFHEDWDQQDEVSMHVTTRRGTMVTLAFSMTGKNVPGEFVIVGSEATLRQEGSKLSIDGEEVPPPAGMTRGSPDEEFADAILEGREPEASGRTVRPSIAAIEAALTSAHQGAPVDLE